MSDQDAVRLLRETLRERAGDIAEPPALVAPTRARPAPRALVVAVAAALVAILAVGGVAAWRSTRPQPAGPVPGAWKPVSSLGVQIYVPPDWLVTGRVQNCRFDDATYHVVMRPFGGSDGTGCGIPRGPERPHLQTVVEFNTPGPAGEKPGRSRLPDGRVQIVWRSPDQGAVVVATGPDGDLLQRVIDTARPIDVDALGCPTAGVRAAWDHRRHGLPPVRLGAVTDVVACFYRGPGDGYRMVISQRFGADRRDALARALERAPAGAAPDRPRECSPDVREEAYVTLRIRAAAGSSVLAVHFDGCLDRYVATPTGQSVLTQPVLSAISGGLGAFLGSHELPQS